MCTRCPNEHDASKFNIQSKSCKLSNFLSPIGYHSAIFYHKAFIACTRSTKKLIFEKTIWLTCVEKCTWWGLLEPCVSFFSDLCHMWPQYNTCAKKNFDVTEWAIYVKYPPAN